MIANLQDVKRYDWEVEDNQYYCADSVDGEWCKFEEAMEASSNSLQQLQAKIAALAKLLEAAKSNGLDSRRVVLLIQDLRQLSAMQ